jgi:hypothetical protein
MSSKTTKKSTNPFVQSVCAKTGVPVLRVPNYTETAHTPGKGISKAELAELPMHLVKVADGIAYYSKDRPRKTETPFGGETDNSAVFDA